MVLTEGQQASSRLRRRSAAITALFFIPIFSSLLYFKLGSPQLPDRPLAQRKEENLEKADFAALVSRLESHLQKNDNDTQGWQLLAKNYRLAGRSNDAVHAYEKVLTLKGETVPALLDLGEAMVEAQNGTVEPDGEHVFVKVLKKDGTNAEARFFLARVKAQKNNRAGALKDLHALFAEAKDGEPWRQIIESEIQRLQGGQN